MIFSKHNNIRPRNPFLVLLLLSWLALPNSLKANEDEEKDKGAIRGRIQDDVSGEAIPFASIGLFDNSGKVLSGMITNEEGRFRFRGLDFQEYYIEISSVGFQKRTIQKVLISKEKPVADLGVILIQRDVKELEEVEIVAEKPPIEYQIDKKIVNVDQQITGKSGTAVDILMNVPSVTVDIEGNVALRGSSGFMVLIDGRPTILENSEALQQIPANSIENIEIITNPSAKYVPDGTAGIINVVTKKDKKQGFNGVVNGNIGIDRKYGGDILLNLRRKKINYFVGADFNQRFFPGHNEGERITIDSDTFFTRYNGDNNSDRFFWNVRGGVGYNPTKKDAFNLEFNYGYREMSRTSALDYQEGTTSSGTLTSYKSVNEHYFDMDFWSVSLNYVHEFAKNHTLTAQFNSRNRDIRESSTNFLVDPDQTISSGQRNTEDGPANVIQTDIQYSLPVGLKGKFETGYQSRIGKSTDDTKLFEYDTLTGGYIKNENFSNYTEYDRDIHALYALFGDQKGRWGYQLGIRGEYTYRTINSSVSPDEFRIDRFDYFPSGHLSVNLENDQQLMASFSRRIERPRSWWLEPFVTVVDAFNVRQGNPNLKPEYVNSFELNYRKGFGRNFFSAELYYRITNNKVERIRDVFSENIMITFPENVGRDYFFGTELSLNIGIRKWWKADLSGNIFHYSIRGTLQDEPYFRESLNWNMRMNNNFTIRKDSRVQISTRYVSATATAQGTREGFWGMDAALAQDFMKKKMTATLQLRNIFQTERRESISEGRDFRTYNLDYRFGPIVILTVTYRFNNFEQKRKGRGSQSSGGSIPDDDF